MFMPPSNAISQSVTGIREITKGNDYSAVLARRRPQSGPEAPISALLHISSYLPFLAGFAEAQFSAVHSHASTGFLK